MNDSEKLAKAIIESVQQGSKMHYYMDQSGGHYDFDLEYPDGTRVPLEVTKSTSVRHIATVAAITNQRKGGSVISAKRCHRGWLVNPMVSANIDQIRANVDKYLAEIEAIGLDKFFSPRDARSYPAVNQIYQKLRIIGGWVIQWKNPREIHIGLPGGGGLIASENLQIAIRNEAFKNDNCTKLGSTNSSERHLFVYVDPLNFLVWKALLDCDPPTEPPPLPEEITDVWAVTDSREEDRYRVWKGTRETDWRNLGLVSIHKTTRDR